MTFSFHSAQNTRLMIRLSDYIVQYLADHGIGHVFMVTGGAAMHLNDAFGRESRIKKVLWHCDQVC
jgi:acetolactate synthase-1/2/3 large subunit